MPSAFSTPYVYKLVSSSSPVPESLPERLPVSEIDEKSGFIHLSTFKQVLGTLKAFFEKDTEIYVLRIPLARIDDDVKWEAPEVDVCGPRDGEGTFPVSLNSCSRATAMESLID